MDSSDYIITLENPGREPTHLQVEKVFPMDGHFFFSILNLETYDVMFGEYLGELTDDHEQNRRIIYDNIISGSSHITFADSYLIDDLYDIWEIW